MGKRRKTAKTGDKGIYKARGDTKQGGKQNGSDDLYDEVDRYHKQNEEEFIALDRQEESDFLDDGVRESVLDLAAGDNSDESEDETSVDDSGDESSVEAAKSLSSTDDDQFSVENEDVRDWGKKKSAYYHGDTADLEIGQDQEDAFLEEEAAKEVQAARYRHMEEADFLPSDAEDDDEGSQDEENDLSFKKKRNLSKLSKADKLRLLKSHHPDILPLVSHFAGVLRDWHSRTNVVTKALCDDKESTPEVSEKLSLLLHP